MENGVDTALNGNLANLGKFPTSYTVSSEAELKTALLTVVGNMSDSETRKTQIRSTAAFGLFGGGYYIFELYRASSTYFCGTAQTYDPPRSIIQIKYNNGTWGFESVALKSDIVSDTYTVTGISSSSNLQMLSNDITITKSGYTVICAEIIGTWDETQWIHTLRINASFTTCTLKSLHIGTAGSNISATVKVTYMKS